MTRSQDQRPPASITPPKKNGDDALPDAALDQLSGGAAATEKVTATMILQLPFQPNPPVIFHYIAIATLVAAVGRVPFRTWLL